MQTRSIYILTLQRLVQHKEDAYQTEVKLHEATSASLEKARTLAKGFHGSVQNQAEELEQLKQQLERAQLEVEHEKRQMDRLVADNKSLQHKMQLTVISKDQAIACMKDMEQQVHLAVVAKDQAIAAKESFTHQMQQALDAKDELIAKMKDEINDMIVGMQDQFKRISAELVSAQECVNSKEAKLIQLETELLVTKTQVRVDNNLFYTNFTKFMSSVCLMPTVYVEIFEG